MKAWHLIGYVLLALIAYELIVKKLVNKTMSSFEEGYEEYEGE